VMELSAMRRSYQETNRKRVDIDGLCI